jgi:hypothetical protein
MADNSKSSDANLKMNLGLIRLNGSEKQPKVSPTGFSSIITVLKAQKTMFTLGWQSGVGQLRKQMQGVTISKLITFEITTGLTCYLRLKTSSKVIYKVVVFLM